LRRAFAKRTYEDWHLEIPRRIKTLRC
jgi:hypothetical protein